MLNKENIVFTGGGTAGHIMPNLALIERLKGQYCIHYIGSENGMERDIIKGIEGVTYHPIPTVKLIRKLSVKNLKIPYMLIAAIKKAKIILKEINPALVFSKGGYVALPVALAAKKSYPLICHESDFSIGLTTKLTAKKAEYFCASFENSIKGYKNGIFTGLPIRQSIYKAKTVTLKPVLLVMGGSLGASAINDCLHQSIDRLCKKFDIIHLTGKGKKIEGIKNNSYTQMEFCADMGQLYAKAAIAISRGGATSLFELIALRIPSVIIPLPKGTSRGDQIDNAKYFKDLGLCYVLQEDSLSPEKLVEAIDDCFEDNQLKKNLAAAKKIDGTEAVVQLIKKTIDTNKTKQN